jgi:hypothetical protein
VASVVSNQPWDLHELVGSNPVDCFVLLEPHSPSCCVFAGLLSLGWDRFLRHTDREIGFVLAVVDWGCEQRHPARVDEEPG